MADRPPPHPLGRRLLGEVDALVTALRGPELARFDFERIASRASVSVVRRPLEPGLQGLTLSPNRVVVNTALRRSTANFTLAHELAHVYRRRGFFAGLRSTEEEWFADWFAREMLLPRAWMDRSWEAPRLAAYGIDGLTTALQLAVTGRAPPIMRYRGRVLCRVCGTHHHRWGCECTSLRSAPPAERRCLPDAGNFIASGRGAVCFPQLSMLG
jgi:hypothetical protein